MLHNYFDNILNNIKFLKANIKITAIGHPRYKLIIDNCK